MADRSGEVLEYLANHQVMTLATTGSHGPWAAAVFYVNNGFNLTFLSSPRSRHGSDLADDQRCAAAIHEDYRYWPEIKGVQIEGRAHILSGSKKVAAIARYGVKFPVVRPGKSSALIRAALDKVAWYELVPERCYFIDNSKGFGHRDEIQLPAM
jgi:hypothetical protein